MNAVTISADGIPIHYEVRGDGSPALVFVHGWSCDRSYWARQVSHFAQHFKVVAIDLAGHGESGLGRNAWTMTAFAEDVVAVVNAVGLSRVVLIGHSMGGPVIVEAARRMSDRVSGLVGVDTMRDVEHTRTEEEINEYVAPFRSDFANAVHELSKAMFVSDSDPVLVEHVVTDMSAAPPEVGVGAAQELSRYECLGDHQRPHLREGLLAISAPMILINSDHWPVNIEGAQRYGLAVWLMSGVGHFVMMEDAETFNRLLDAAIKRFFP